MQEIDLKNCWCIQNVIKRQSCFFDALKQFSGDGLRLYIEANTNPAGRKILDSIMLDTNMIIDIGSISPQPNKIFHFDVADAVLDTLSSCVADRNIYVNHVAVYKDGEILLAFPDAFMKNSIVDLSKSLDSKELNRFCEVLGVSLQESRYVYPELFI